MKKTQLISIAICTAFLVVGAQAFAEITVKIEVPEITFTGPNAEVNTALSGLFDVTNSTAFQAEKAKYETSAASELDKFGEQDDLAKGFADANMAAAQSSTLQGFEGYKTFAVMGGFMLGVQLPSTDTSVISDLSNTLADDPDVYAGVAPSVSLNVGFNLGKILGLFNNDLGDKTKRVYVNVKGGYYNGSYDGTDDTSFDMKSTTFGLGVNYMLVRPIGLGLGLFKWRGLSVGSGLTYQRNTFDSSTTLDPIDQNFSMATTATGGIPVTVNGILTAVPKVDIGVDMRTFAIPLEAVTSVQLLYVLNVTAGLGVDLVFGHSDITATSGSTLSVKSVSTTVAGVSADLPYTETKQGSVTVDASTSDIKPTFARARVMGGIGLNAGPVKFDVPMYYYFSSGFGVGMSVGFVW